MTRKELQLVAAILEAVADDYHSSWSRDFRFPDGWTDAERRAFVREYHDYNGDPEAADETLVRLPDFALLAFVAHKLRKDME
jgi:hypothetical protein